MSNKALKTPRSTLYKKINGELVVIQLDTSHYYYFNEATEPLLEFLKEPCSVEELTDSLAPTQAEELKSLCKFLLEKKILDEVPSKSGAPRIKTPTLSKPAFLREGEKTLDQISFASP